MRRAAALALFTLLLAGCAAQMRQPPWTGPTYTRASVAERSTAELAAQLLDPAVAATIERHVLTDTIWSIDHLHGIIFIARPRPLTGDICARDSHLVSMRLADPADWRRRRNDAPVRVDRTMSLTRIALAPDCEARPGRRFADVGFRYANVGTPMTLEEGIETLRRLATARTAAAGTGPLPFRLTCRVESEWMETACPADLRSVLAELPLHRAITVNRAPFQTNTLCGPPRPATGDSVEIEISEEPNHHVWEVRLRDWGTPQASLNLNFQARRDSIRC